MIQESKHTQLNEEHWDKWADKIDGKGWRYEFLRKIQKDVVALLDLKPDINFLDIGCGTGWALYHAAQRINNHGTFYGIDLSSKMIEKAKENFRGNGNFHFIKANSEAIPLDENFFDVIISTNSFHHYLHPDKALYEIYRILKPGGQFYLEDPPADYLLAKIADKIMRLLEPGHVKMYSTKEIQSLFAAAGLKYTDTVGIVYHEKVHIGEKERHKVEGQNSKVKRATSQF